MTLFENFKDLGEALKNWGKSNKGEEKEPEKTSTEKLIEFQKAKEEYQPTEEQIALSTIEDYRAGQDKPIERGQDILVQESKEEKKEDELDKKIKNIQKVLKEFGEEQAPTVIKQADALSIADQADKLNVQPLDMGITRQKELLAQLPRIGSEKDRIELLYQDLMKRNLI